MTGSCLRWWRTDRQERDVVPHCGSKEDGPHLAPLTKEPDVIDPGGLGTLRCWEEERYGRYIGELRGPGRKWLLAVSNDPVVGAFYREQHGDGSGELEGKVNCLLQRVLADFASYRDVELLQGLLVLGVREIKIVDVRKLGFGQQGRGGIALEDISMKIVSGKTTYESYFGRRLVAGSGLEQERAQLHRSGKRDAYDAALTVSATGRRKLRY
jgi:hypothetical protein